MSILENMRLKAHYDSRLYQIQKRANPQRAVDSGAKTCQRSGHCCWMRPCDLFPGDPERIAAHLGITPQELFRDHLVVDDMADGNGLRLLPRRGQQVGGRYLTARETYDIDTPCTFLDVSDSNACRIQPVKPTGGAWFHCTMTDAELARRPVPKWTVEQLQALGWDGDIDG